MKSIGRKEDLRHFVNGPDLSRMVGLSVEAIRRYRQGGVWIEDLHYIKVSDRMILYCVPLIIDFLHNINDGRAHLRAIENYQATLPSNQPKKKGRKAKPTR